MCQIDLFDNERATGRNAEAAGCQSNRLDLAFASGMTNKSDMRGAIDAKVPFGVVAGSLTTAQMTASVPRYLDDGGFVFVDSGAFTSERTGAEICWENILGRYEFIADVTDRPENLFVVAPDKVGDQDETLRLIDMYRGRLCALIARGVNVIVPLQVGTISPQAMIDRVGELLSCRTFIAGIPSNKAAMSIEDCRTLNHTKFHILGRVQVDAEQEMRIEALRSINPIAMITADANWLRSRIGLISRFLPKRSENIFDHPRTEAVKKAFEFDRYRSMSSMLC